MPEILAQRLYIKAIERITSLEEHVEKLEAELHLLKTSCIAEVAVRNPSVMEYIKHWESRTEKAEARMAELEAALKIISDMPHSDTCSKELTFMAHGCDCHVEEARAALKGKDDG